MGVSTEVEVRFVPFDGCTRVELEHRGWERLGELANTARIDYDQGWLAGPHPLSSPGQQLI